MNSYSEVIESITRCAKNLYEVPEANLTFEEMLDLYCRGAVESYSARLRDAGYSAYTPANELISEDLCNFHFYAMVSEDILDGKISRPSIGNVREYALNLYRTLEVA